MIADRWARLDDLKHLPGQHDQSTHGRGYRAPAPGFAEGEVSGAGVGSGKLSAEAVTALSTLPGEGKLGGKASKAWVKKHQAIYESDSTFRATVDAILLYTQGSYKWVRDGSIKALTGQDSKYEGDPSTIPLGRAADPRATYKTVFDGQTLDNREVTLAQAGGLLTEAIHQSQPLAESLYRGVLTTMRVSDMGEVSYPYDFQVGQQFELHGTSSFTRDTGMAEKFSVGAAPGQGRRRGELSVLAVPVVFEIQPGARGLPVDALSPWGQSEVITTGIFQVTGVERTSAGKTRGYRVKLEQLDTWGEDS